MIFSKVVVSKIFFPPPAGEMIQFDEHIFQMGWFNIGSTTKSFWKIWFPWPAGSPSEPTFDDESRPTFGEFGHMDLSRSLHPPTTGVK